MKIAPSIEILESRGIEVREFKINKRKGIEVYTILGKENDRVSTFQLNGDDLIYFDRESGEPVERLVHRFPNRSRKEEMKAAIEHY